jgi:hypothetical protein
VVNRPTGHTKLWVFVEVELQRNDGGASTKRWFAKVLGVTNVELPTGWAIVPLI